MELRQRINATLKQAMRDKESERLATLRLINAAIRDREIAKRTEDGEDAVHEAEVLEILSKMVKQRRESVRAYEEAGRLDLAEAEQDEIAVIEEFLPRKLSEAEVEKAIDAAVEEVGAASIRDMGKVMGALKARYTGQMDFGAVGAKVKARLG